MKDVSTDKALRKEFEDKMDKHINAIKRIMKEYGVLEYHTNVKSNKKARFKTDFMVIES